MAEESADSKRPDEGVEEGSAPVSSTENGAASGEPNDHTAGGGTQSEEHRDVPPRGSSKPALNLQTDGPFKPENLTHHPADDLHEPDSPTTSLIESLRTQLSLLSEQSVQLNTKLIASISKHADLEDQHFQLQEQHRVLGERAEGLERDKRHFEESMNTGLLVERAQISAEMQKLAAGLVEEERKRGSAEERRKQVESEVDDLSASLFDQANTMVAQERHGRIEAEERLKSAQDNLAVAEAAVRDMQVHLQSMPTSSRSPPSAPPPPKDTHRRYLASHVPYTEYLAFLAHLRSLRPLRETSKHIFPPPLIVNLLAQPFLARVSAEDHDATLRLDIAPDISWLSRKGVNQAVIAGELIIEPVSASTVIAGSSNPVQDIGCSLCGKPVFPATHPPSSPVASHFGPPPTHPTQRQASSSRFSLKPFFNSTSPNPTTYNASPTSSPLASPGLPAMASLGSVYIFRVNKPLPPSGTAQAQDAKLYPLCKTGWCLERLRATCELWHFLRTGVVHVVWHGDDGYLLSSEGGAVAAAGAADGPHTPGAVVAAERAGTPTNTEVEAAPEMNRKKSSAWGLGFKLADKAPSGWAKAWNRTSSGTTTHPAGAVVSGTGEPGSPRRMPPPPPAVGQVDSNHEVSEAKVAATEVEEKAQESPVQEKVEESPVEEKEKVEEAATEEKPEDVAVETTAEVADTKEAEKEAPSDEKPEENAEAPAEAAPAKAPAEEEDDLLASLQAQLEASSPPRPTKKLGAPLELDSDVPAISETAPTPLATATQEVPDPMEVPESGSIKSSGSDEFTTPTETHQDLVPEPLTAAEDAEHPEGVQTTPKKPPVPKRSAGRTPRGPDGGNTPAEGGSRSVSPAPAPALTEAVLTSSPSPSAPPLPARRGTADAGEEHKDGPPLPPRHPRTPNAQITFAQTVAPDGEKAWIPENKEGGEESWEVKTWKTVIRLKEEMWKRRIGVMDGDDE